VNASLRVVTPGLHTTIQDLGRFGYQDVGVPVSGALDAFSYRAANRVAGNPENTAALEILYQAPVLEVLAESARVGLAGGEAELELTGERAHLVGGWRSVLLRRGEVFRVVRLGQSACCYLALEGGFAVEPCLGSASTFVRGDFGGFNGRPLRQGDLLPIRQNSVEDRGEVCIPQPPPHERDKPVRIVLGPQADHFTDAAIECLTGAEYRVSKNADRMGMRLDGPLLQHRDGYNIVSDGIATGAIQVPGSGQPILLLADHQTTGGYPKIATVASADLAAVGRRRAGDAIRFSVVDVATAERLRRDQEVAFQALMSTMAPAEPMTGLDLDSLYRTNLISGAVSGHE
jgi:allophanate hydrolase